MSILSKTLKFEFELGTGLAAIIGLTSGIFSVISASNLDSVEAIMTGT